MKKKIAVLLLLAMVVTAFAGCDNKPVEVRTITVWHSLSEGNGLLFDEFVAEFNAGIGAEKGIKVEATFQGKYTDSLTKLRANLQADNVADLPDICQIDATGIADVKESKYLKTISAMLTEDSAYDISQIDTSSVKNLTYKDQVIGMPFNNSAQVLFYNKTMFDTAGITEAPETLGDIAEILPALTTRDANGNVEIYGFACNPNTPTIVNWIGQLNGVSYMVDNRNGRDGDPTKVIFDEEGTMETFLTAWKDLYATGGLKHVEGSSRDEFMSGRLAMFITSTSNIATILDTVSFDVGVAPFPRTTEEAATGATIGGAGFFLFDKDNAQANLDSWEFLKFLTSPEIQARWGMGTGYFPVNNGSYDLPDYQAHVVAYPQFQVAIDQLRETDPEMQGLWVPSSYQFYMELQNGIINMLETNQPVEDTVAALASVCNQLIEEFNNANTAA